MATFYCVRINGNKSTRMPDPISVEAHAIHGKTCETLLSSEGSVPVIERLLMSMKQSDTRAREAWRECNTYDAIRN